VPGAEALFDSQRRLIVEAPRARRCLVHDRSADRSAHRPFSGGLGSTETAKAISRIARPPHAYRCHGFAESRHAAPAAPLERYQENNFAARPLRFCKQTF
jgi:hypothetical protein